MKDILMIRDKNKHFISYFIRPEEANDFIKRNDPEGSKGYYIVKK